MIAGRALPGWARWVAAGVCVAAALLIGYRVLAPVEVSTPARGAPPAAVGAPVGVIGTLSAAPLIVQGRLRVYAGPRQVRADGPADQRTQWSPYWSYRRWPARLVGVVASGATVVGQWSDGDLVALSAERGLVRWRARGPALPGASSMGRRTGAVTVYAPPHLYLAGATVVSAGPGEARGYDAESGRELWRAALPGCAGRVDFTAGGRFAWACGPALAAVDAATGGRLPDWSAPRTSSSCAAASCGAVQPIGCELGRSGCHGLRAGGRGYVWGPVAPAASAALDPGTTWLVTGAGGEEIAVDAGLTARDATTGRQLWRRSDPGRLIAAGRGSVHVLTAAHDLVTLDAVTGARRSGFRATAYGQATTWTPGAAAAMGGYLCVERLHPGARPADPNSAYYFEARPVLLARTG